MAFDDSILAGSTSKIIEVFMRDTASSVAAGKTGLAHSAVTANYVREGGTRVAITMASGTAGDSYSSGKWCQIDSTNMPGWYSFHVPNAAIAAGAAAVSLNISATGAFVKPIRLKLRATNVQDATRGGMAALPNAAAGAGTGFPALVGANSALAHVTGYEFFQAPYLLSAAISSITGAGTRLNLTPSGGLSGNDYLTGLVNCVAVQYFEDDPSAVVAVRNSRITGASAGTGAWIEVEADAAFVAGNVRVYPAQAIPANFRGMGINSSGHVSRVTTTDMATALGTNAITPTAIQDAAFTDAKFGPAFVKNTSLENDAITAGKIAAGAITSAKFAAGAINAAAIATDTITAAKIATDAITAAKIATDAGTEIGTAVWATTTRILTAGTNIALAKGTGVTGFNDLDAEGVRGAVGLASANLDTQLSNISGFVDALETRIPSTINVTDLNNTTSRFLTMIVIDGAVYQFTANALELAPAGGGGTADWTADERTAIKAILGVPGSGTTPVTPTTGMLDTINDNIASLSAGSGSGAFVVTITVTDGTNPLQNAIVRLTEGANTFRATTNVSGVATFSLNAATYTRSITKDGYTFTPNSLVVAGATSSTSAMTATTIPPPASPSGCTVTIRARTQQLVPQAGVIIGFRYISLPTGSGMALPVNPLLITTDVNGDAQAELLQGATVKYWRGREPALASTTNTFTVPAASTHTLADLLGEDAT